MREIDWEITEARPEDLPLLPAIESAAERLFPEDDIPPALRGQPLPVSLFAEAHARGALFVARLREPGAPVGFALMREVDGQQHLHELDVHPDHGRRGIGRALVEHVCHWAQTRGANSVSLTSFRHLPWNAPFYADLGFRALAQDEIGPELRALLDDEAAQGFDPAKRVAMRRPLDAT